MLTDKNKASGSTAATAVTMTSKVSRARITRSKIESVLSDSQVNKDIKLETLIQYLEQIKNEPVEVYIEEAGSLLSLLVPKFEGTKEYYLLWVRFLDIAYVHLKNKASEEQQEASYKTGIVAILTRFLLKGQKVKSIDWRIARKILSLNDQFSLPDIDLPHVEEGILKSFKNEIDIALGHLLWPKESLFVDSSNINLTSLRQCFDSPTEPGKKDLLEALMYGRFDKEKFKLKNSLILGEDGGLYVLLNRMNQPQQDALVAEQIVTRDYLEDKIKARDQDRGDQVVLGTGGFGTVKFALSLLRSKSLPGEIVCVKKTRSFQDLGGSFKPTPLEQITESTLGDYFTNDRAHAIYSPFILDMALVTTKNVIKDDMKDHRKGYLMMEIIPQNTATRIFADERYQKWEYQKPYLLDVLENTQKLLESDIAMTDLKPDNTLYDTDIRKATIIDLGGSVKVENAKELSRFDITKYPFQSTKGFKAPELEGSTGVVNMHQALAYTCGKVIEEVTRKSDYDQQVVSQLIKRLTASESEARMPIYDAINELKRMGDDSYKKNVIFSHYISKVKDRLENKKSAISINEDIDRTRDLLITLNATSSDPLKYKSQQTEDLFQKIDNFLASSNTNQVMAIFGAAGSGKSIALQLKFIQAVNTWQPGQPLPIYFNLANGLDLDQIVRNLNAELDTNLSLKDLDGQHLYIDSFDEGLGIEHKRETLIKEYFRKLGSPKILITCRTDYLEDNSYDWFSPESKELEVCYVAPINYNGHKGLAEIVKKYVDYSMRGTSIQHKTQDYLNRLKELQLTDLINTGFMFFLIMEVLFQLQNKKEGRVNKVDVYANYTGHYQNSQIAQLKNQDQKEKLAEMTVLWKSNKTPDLCSFATELAKYLACQMHFSGQSRLGESDKLFAALGYDNSVLLKHQTMIHMLKLLPLKIVTTHSGKRIISDQEVKIGFIHETIKNYYLLEAIKSEIEREGKSVILSSKSIVHNSELVKMIVLAMKDNQKLTFSFLKAIENSKLDKSTPSIIHASNSISLLVAAKHSFSGCDLSNIAVKGANIVNGIFENANLVNADLSDVDMSNVDITGASLNGADMARVKLSILPDLVGHNSYVNSVSFSPDGKFLASGSEDGTIKIWNLSDGECLQTLNKHANRVNSVSFSADGKFLASGSRDQTINIWNPSTGELLQTISGFDDYVNKVSFSPDGKYLASGSMIRNASTGECLQTLDGHYNNINSFSFSADGKFLASGSSDKTIKIWNTSTGKCLQTLNGHTDRVTTVSFSPDGKFLASGSEDKKIMIWNPSTGERLQALNGHTHEVESVSFSPDGKFLSSGSEDKTIKIWNPSTGELLQTLNGHNDCVNSVSFSPDGKFLASGSKDQTIKIWILSIGECLQTLDGHTQNISSASFSPDGKLLASGSKDQTIKIWSPSTSECLQTLNGHTDAVSSVSFSPDGKFLASGSFDETIKIWNPSTGEYLQTFKHAIAVTSISFSSDGKFLASGSGSHMIGIVNIWNSSSGERLHTLNGHTQIVNSVSFSPDGKFLASGSTDRTMKIWDTSTGQCLQTLKGHSYHVISVSFSPDGRFLASGSIDQTIKIWNLSTGDCLQTLKEHKDCVNSVNFSPDGKFLASGSSDQTIKIWDPSTGKCLQTLNRHAGLVSSVSFSADSKFLASASYDKTTKVFEFDIIRNVWLLKNNMTATLSPLLASGAILNQTKISHSNRLILSQKGADTTLSVTDDTISQREPHKDISLESNHMIDQLSQFSFDVKMSTYQQSQDSRLVMLSVNPLVHSDQIEHQQNQDPKLITSSLNQPAHVILDNSRSNVCCGPSQGCKIFAVPKIIYDNPLLNSPALFAQISHTLGFNEALKLSNR